MIKILLTILICIISLPAKAMDTINAQAGTFIYLKIDLESPAILGSQDSLSTVLEVQNRTLLLPVCFCNKDSVEISTEIKTENRYKYTITTDTDSTCEVSELVYLKCKVLAGADVKTEILLTNTKIGDQDIAQKSFLLNIVYINKPLVYIRYFDFPKLYPSPLYAGQDIICEFTLDRTSEVEFVLACMNGETYVLDKRTFSKGDIKHHLPTSKSLAAGAYRLRIKTNHGEVSKKFMVAK